MRPRGLEDRAARPGRPKAGDAALSVAPGVKPLAAAPEALTGIVVGSGDEAVERHRHVEHRAGHRLPLVKPAPRRSVSIWDLERL
jgi:hypothetical protein